MQIGYGPVSKVLAMMLARQGLSVGVFERYPEPYTLPRAVCIDHELYRVLHAAGFAEELKQVCQPAPLYQWFNAEWKTLLEIDWTQESISGGPEVNFVHQPTLEAALDKAVRKRPEVAVHMGQQAVRVAQTPEYAEVDVKDAHTGEIRTVRGRYLVGTDGANSFVRESLGIAREDLGFEADWLVIDMLLNEGLTHESLGIPAAGQYCNPLRPTTIVPGGIQNGRVCRRWEFMRLPHETRADMESTEAVWRLLGRWVKPDQAELVRHTIYTFRSLIAEDWRRGRILLAGDAAHLMPPFMGQGMCAGFRDAWNLSWKLGAILKGEANDRLLDTYMPERRPHVTEIIKTSVFLGKIICVPDPVAAAERDRAFLSGEVPPPPPFPWLTDGLLHDPANDPMAGRLSPHGLVRLEGRTARFDEFVGTRFHLVSRAGDPAGALDEAQRALLAAHDVALVRIGPADAAEEGQFQDLEGKFLPFMEANGIAAMIVRPDYYIFGSTPALAGLGALVDAFAKALAANGM